MKIGSLTNDIFEETVPCYYHYKPKDSKLKQLVRGHIAPIEYQLLSLVQFVYNLYNFYSTIL